MKVWKPTSVLTLVLALVTARGTRLPAESLASEVTVWVLAGLLAGATAILLKFPQRREPLPVSLACAVGLLLLPPSPTGWLAAVPDSLAAAAMLVHVFVLHRIVDKHGIGRIGQRRGVPSARPTLLLVLGWVMAAEAAVALTISRLPPRLGALFLLQTALAPLVFLATAAVALVAAASVWNLIGAVTRRIVQGLASKADDEESVVSQAPAESAGGPIAEAPPTVSTAGQG